MKSRSSASVTRDEQAVNGPVTLRKGANGIHYIDWRNAPMEGRDYTMDDQLATVWDVDDRPGKRALLAQMLAGPALYAAALEVLNHSHRVRANAGYGLLAEALDRLSLAAGAASTLVVEGEVGNG